MDINRFWISYYSYYTTYFSKYEPWLFLMVYMIQKTQFFDMFMNPNIWIRKKNIKSRKSLIFQINFFNLVQKCDANFCIYYLQKISRSYFIRLGWDKGDQNVYSCWQFENFKFEDTIQKMLEMNKSHFIKFSIFTLKPLLKF